MSRGLQNRMGREVKRVEALWNKYSEAASRFTARRQHDFLPTNNNVAWLVAWLNLAEIPELGSEFAALIGAMNESARWHDSLTRRISSGRGLEYVRSVAALQVIEGLSKDGSLRRIRRCDWCRAWLFAKNRRQTFCSDRCRENAFRKTPEGRAKRTQFMRDYREREKLREESALKAARGE